MKDFDFFGFLDAHATRERFKPVTDTSHFYPSESSVRFYDKHGDKVTEGGCLRASYFRVVGGFEKVGYSAYTQWIFEMGNRVESMLIDSAKEAGIWVDNSIRFYDEEYNVSGEVDLLIREPDTGNVVPYEVKSCYGYFAQKEVLGNTKQAGFPKMSQLTQLLVYLWKFKDQFPYGRMAYFFRDTTQRKTFKVALHTEGKNIYPVIDGQIFRLFTINDILARYKELQGYVERKEIPPADYELQYPDDKIHDFAKKGKIGKTKYNLWLKGKLKPHEYIGDWRCSYCGYQKICHPDMVENPVEKTHL